MKKYLLDTNICIYHIKGLFDIDKKIARVGIENCFLSEITINDLILVTRNVKHFERLSSLKLKDWTKRS